MIKYKVFESKEDWASFRKGLFTASEIHRLLSEPKKKTELLSEGAKTYVHERIASLLAPTEPEYYNSSMDRGNEVEPQAALGIANLLGYDLNDDEFIYTSQNGYVFFWDEFLSIGGTPDLILKNHNAIAEIKCPKSTTHLSYLMLTSENIKDKCTDYYAQMQVNMYLTNTKLCFFASFDDRYYDTKHHLKTIVVNYDSEFIERLFEKVNLANQYKQSILNKINE